MLRKGIVFSGINKRFLVTSTKSIRAASVEVNSHDIDVTNNAAVTSSPFSSTKKKDNNSNRNAAAAVHKSAEMELNNILDLAMAEYNYRVLNNNSSAAASSSWFEKSRSLGLELEQEEAKHNQMLIQLLNGETTTESQQRGTARSSTIQFQTSPKVITKSLQEIPEADVRVLDSSMRKVFENEHNVEVNRTLPYRERYGAAYFHHPQAKEVPSTVESVWIFEAGTPKGSNAVESRKAIGKSSKPSRNIVIMGGFHENDKVGATVIRELVHRIRTSPVPLFMRPGDRLVLALGIPMEISDPMKSHELHAIQSAFGSKNNNIRISKESFDRADQLKVFLNDADLFISLAERADSAFKSFVRIPGTVSEVQLVMASFFSVLQHGGRPVGTNHFTIKTEPNTPQNNISESTSTDSRKEREMATLPIVLDSEKQYCGIDNVTPDQYVCNNGGKAVAVELKSFSVDYSKYVFRSTLDLLKHLLCYERIPIPYPDRYANYLMEAPGSGEFFKGDSRFLPKFFELFDVYRLNRSFKRSNPDFPKFLDSYENMQRVESKTGMSFLKSLGEFKFESFATLKPSIHKDLLGDNDPVVWLPSRVFARHGLRFKEEFTSTNLVEREAKSQSSSLSVINPLDEEVPATTPSNIPEPSTVAITAAAAAEEERARLQAHYDRIRRNINSNNKRYAVQIDRYGASYITKPALANDGKVKPGEFLATRVIRREDLPEKDLILGKSNARLLLTRPPIRLPEDRDISSQAKRYTWQSLVQSYNRAMSSNSQNRIFSKTLRQYLVYSETGRLGDPHVFCYPTIHRIQGIYGYTISPDYLSPTVRILHVDFVAVTSKKENGQVRVEVKRDSSSARAIKTHYFSSDSSIIVTSNENERSVTLQVKGDSVKAVGSTYFSLVKAFLELDKKSLSSLEFHQGNYVIDPKTFEFSHFILDYTPLEAVFQKGKRVLKI